MVSNWNLTPFSMQYLTHFSGRVFEVGWTHQRWSASRVRKSLQVSPVWAEAFPLLMVGSCAAERVLRHLFFLCLRSSLLIGPAECCQNAGLAVGNYFACCKAVALCWVDILWWEPRRLACTFNLCWASLPCFLGAWTFNKLNSMNICVCGFLFDCLIL